MTDEVWFSAGVVRFSVRLYPRAFMRFMQVMRSVATERAVHLSWLAAENEAGYARVFFSVNVNNLQELRAWVNVVVQLNQYGIVPRLDGALGQDLYWVVLTCGNRISLDKKGSKLYVSVWDGASVQVQKEIRVRAGESARGSGLVSGARVFLRAVDKVASEEESENA